jgi:hypothetical protein
MRSWFACVLLLVASSTSAQGSRSSAGPASPDYGAFSVLRQVSGVLIAADEAEGTVSVKPDGAEEAVAFKVLPKIRLSAEKKTALAGRKGLVLSDFEPGQSVKVTFRASDLTAVELRLRVPRP